MSATESDSRPALVLVVEPGSTRLLASIARFNDESIPVVEAPPVGSAAVVLPTETVFVRSFGYADFVDADGALIVFWSADRDRRAACGESRYGDTPPAGPWREPNLLDLRGLPVAFSMRHATAADVARGYIGYIGDLPSDADPLSSLPSAELLKAASMRLYGKAPRVQRIARSITRRG